MSLAADPQIRPEPAVDERYDREPLLLLNMVLRRWRVAIGVPVASIALAVSAALLPRSSFVATSEFMPQSTEATASRLSGLAAQFGFSIASPAASAESPDFYAQLIQSRELLEEVVNNQYQAHVDGGMRVLTGNIQTLLLVSGSTPEVRLRRSVARLRKRIGVSVNLKTGVIVLRVTAPWPDLAEQINEKVLELVNRYNLTRRQTRAAAERQFVEARLREAQNDLASAEADLERFYERNRSFEHSPQLRFESARLQRRVDLRQQVYTSLAQSFEQARIEEVRNTPVITIIDRPQGSALRARGDILLSGFLGLLAGLALMLVWVFGREYLESQRLRHPADYAEFVTLRSALLARLIPQRLARRREQGAPQRHG